METSQKGTIDKMLLVMWIIWAAMMGSLVIYIVICNLFGNQIRQPVGPDFPLALLRNIFFGVSIVALIAAHFIRKFILSKRSDTSGSVSPFQPSPQGQVNIYGKYLSAMIISLALCESIGVYGLALFFLGSSFQTLYSFLLVSAVGMFYYRPKREEIEALSRAH
ncbi:MAG: hypothetical protein JW896_07055 [Deltaproteobacteria bacterium]|nr:hypothetical protein [Deltaproteobacteria bacterium]